MVKIRFEDVKWPLSYIGIAGKGTKLNDYYICRSTPLWNYKVQGHTNLYVWKFQMDFHLRLKIVFNYMYFALKNIYSCYSGNVSVKSFNLGNEDSPITYCGIRTYLVAYPHYNNVSIQMSVRHYVKYFVLAIYNVIDYNISLSCKVLRDNNSLVPDFVIYTIPSKMFSQKFHLQVPKWQIMNIIVHLSNIISIWTLDGPGTVSSNFRNIFQKSSKYQFLTSSYHYLMYIEMALNYKTQIIYFKPHTRKINKVISVRKNTAKTTSFNLLYPESICSKNLEVCILKIQTSEQTKINITITHLSIDQEDLNEGCLFHGLSVYDHLNTTKDELSTICIVSFSRYRHRNIYSKTNDLLLVLYSFKAEGSMNVNFLVSNTYCNVIQIDTCATSNKIYLTSPTSICTVHQLRHDLSISSFEDLIKRGCKQCQLQNLLYSENGRNKGKVLQISTSGFMRGKF